MKMGCRRVTGMANLREVLAQTHLFAFNDLYGTMTGVGKECIYFFFWFFEDDVVPQRTSEVVCLYRPENNWMPKKYFYNYGEASEEMQSLSFRPPISCRDDCVVA